jgi:hypothetical protein
MRRSISELPGALPKTTIPDDIQPAEILAESIGRLQSLHQEDLVEDALWRDSFILTGTQRTFFGADRVFSAWTETSTLKASAGFAVVPPTAHVSRHGEYAWIEARFTFQTTKGALQMLGSGSISLVPSAGPDGKWKIWALTTLLENFCGEKDVDYLSPGIPTYVKEEGLLHPDVVVVGGGSSGLSVGGRLHALGVSYVVIDQNNQVGGNWINRYDSVKRNDCPRFWSHHLLTLTAQFTLPRNMVRCSQIFPSTWSLALYCLAHLPFERTFDATYPEYLSREDLERGFQSWADKYNIVRRIYYPFFGETIPGLMLALECLDLDETDLVPAPRTFMDSKSESK